MCLRRYTLPAGETRVTLDDFPNGRAEIHLEVPHVVFTRMTKIGMSPADVFNAMIAAAPKVGIVAVDIPTMGKYFDSKGAMIPGAGPKLAAALGIGSAMEHKYREHRMGQRGIVLARVDRGRGRIHLVEPLGVSLTGSDAVQLGLVPRAEGATRRKGDEALDAADQVEPCPLVRFGEGVVHEAVTPRGRVVIENKHATDVESAAAPPLVCISIHPHGKSCSEPGSSEYFL